MANPRRSPIAVDPLTINRQAAQLPDELSDKLLVDLGIPKSYLMEIRKEGAAARKEMTKYGCTEAQIRRGLFRILDATLGTQYTREWD